MVEEKYNLKAWQYFKTAKSGQSTGVVAVKGFAVLLDAPLTVATVVTPTSLPVVGYLASTHLNGQRSAIIYRSVFCIYH